jgi:NADH pyrophosphatase NudC (nudix superfamily)
LFTDAGWFDLHNLPELPPKMRIARELIDWFIESRLAKGEQYTDSGSAQDTEVGKKDR